MFFHSAESNVAILDSACRVAPAISAAHVVDTEVFARAQRARVLAPALRAEAADRMSDALSGADALVCTCSTLGPAADDLARKGLPVRRIDRALAERAIDAPGPLRVLVAAESTLAATRELFDDVAAAHGATVELEVRLVPDAWAEFQAGRTDRYLDRIATAASEARADAPTIALGQTSMAAAADRCDFPVLTSPGEVVTALVADAES